MGNNNSCCSNKRGDFASEQQRIEANTTYVHKICLHSLTETQTMLKQVMDRTTEPVHFDTQKASYAEDKELVIFDIWTKQALFRKDIQG